MHVEIQATRTRMDMFVNFAQQDTLARSPPSEALKSKPSTGKFSFLLSVHRTFVYKTDNCFDSFAECNRLLEEKVTTKLKLLLHIRYP